VRITSPVTASPIWWRSTPKWRPLYAEGRSVLALARGYGVNDNIIRTSLYRSGVALRGKGGRPSKIPEWGYGRAKPE
jgi:hypothetical protein